jgi:hypothetical protein
LILTELELTFSGEEVRRALQHVLAPDNEGGPRELRISVRGKERRLMFRITARSPSTAISTALGILRDVSLFEEVWLLSHEADARGRQGLDPV